MTELFSKADIDFKPLSEYVGSFLDEKNANYNLVQLPPIQRNAVWNSNQIERLWDSILRGFPIGSFILSKRKKGNTTRSIYSTTQNQSKNEGYFLLDGQQRTRAILLGFKPNADSRLWIDLNPNLSFGNSEFNDRQFLFRLITAYQPWGMNDRNPSEKLREPEKYQARKTLYEDSVRYDYNVKINTGEINEGNLDKFSWPVKATLPVPFDALLNLCGGFGEGFIEPDWSDVLKLVPEQFTSKIENEPTEHFILIMDALKNLFYSSAHLKKVRCISFIHQNVSKELSNDMGDRQDSIEVLFRRINSGGTQLDGEEMAYSLLKSNWDKAYDLVSNIINDDKIGYLFPPTGIVMAAARIARFNMKENDDANPSGSNFRKWIGENKKIEVTSFLEEMKKLLEIDNGKSKFHLILERFLNLVLFRGNKDIGLPRKLLVSIKPTMIHPVLIWLCNSDSLNDENNRESILRYLIYSFVGVLDFNKASKKAIEILKTDCKLFPDKEIYEYWLTNKLARRIPEFELFKSTFLGETTGFLKKWDEVLGEDDNIYRDFRNMFWHKKELLLWFQRKYIAEWFVGYNPMSNDAYDTPYDYDHIVPYSHLIVSGGKLNTYSTNVALNNNFSTCRYLYINSIGNYRIWPSWVNRADNNICHTEKMHMKKDDLAINGVAVELLFKANKDFMTASLINNDDFNLWKDAGGNPSDWSEIRRKAWQQAVENRVIFLFDIFFNSFEFSKWLIND